MRINSFEIDHLLGRPGIVRAELDADLNILTGRNGAGKTSILKILWYIVSGNIILATKEIVFRSVTINTDKYQCTVYRINRVTCKVDITINGKTTTYEDIQDEDGDVVINAEDQANPIIMELGSSLFLPTFRRIEGGFTLTGDRTSNSMNLGFLGSRATNNRSDIENAMVALSRTLTRGSHTFIAAISTADIVSLLLARYADLSNEYAEFQQSTSQDIISRIKDFRADKGDSGEVAKANDLLDNVRVEIETMEKHRENIMSPIEAVKDVVERLFRHIGIKIGTRLSFGDAANAINSDALSAGEKQMLSFICYNAFNKNCVMFVDEPELSLHVDWQRQLFTILGGQKSSNQFIIATHSPFIYSKFPDKEIIVDPDKGESEITHG